MSSNNSASHLQVAGVVSFYMGAALVMVFVNKAVLNSFPDLPLLFLLNQLLLAVVLLHASRFLSAKIEIPRLDIVTAKKMFPVVSVNVIGLVFNTLCLRDVEASFFQIARGLVLPMTIIVSSLHTRSIPPKQVIAASTIVVFGFFLGVSPSGLPAAGVPSTISLIYGFLSSLFIALHAVFIKMSLPHCNNSSIQLAYWTNAGSAFLLAPFILFTGDLTRFMALLGTADISVFLWGTFVTGFFGFLLCISAVISIKVTSPITHMFSSAVRSVLQTMLGVWIFNDFLTVYRVGSIAMILAGTMYYTWIKSGPQAAPKPSHPADPESAKDTLTVEMSDKPVKQ